LTFGVASLQEEAGLREVSHGCCGIPKVQDKKINAIKKKDIRNNTAHSLRGHQIALFKNIFFHVFFTLSVKNT